MANNTIWKGESERVLESKRGFVRAYLNENEISPTSAGYNVLLYVILKASENPTFSCGQLFDCYAEEVLKEKTKKASKGAYKNAYYAVKHSASKTKSAFRFIKECSISLE